MGIMEFQARMSFKTPTAGPKDGKKLEEIFILKAEPASRLGYGSPRM